MINTKKLKAEFVKNSYTYDDIAKLLGISTRALSNKIKKGVFKSNEIEDLIKILGIQDPIDIFFTS